MREKMQELALNIFHELSKKMARNNTWHANQIHASFLLAEMDDFGHKCLPFSLTCKSESLSLFLSLALFYLFIYLFLLDSRTLSSMIFWLLFLLLFSFLFGSLHTHSQPWSFDFSSMFAFLFFIFFLLHLTSLTHTAGKESWPSSIFVF